MQQQGDCSQTARPLPLSMWSAVLDFTEIPGKGLASTPGLLQPTDTVLERRLHRQYFHRSREGVLFSKFVFSKMKRHYGIFLLHAYLEVSHYCQLANDSDSLSCRWEAQSHGLCYRTVVPLSDDLIL